MPLLVAYRYGSPTRVGQSQTNPGFVGQPFPKPAGSMKAGRPASPSGYIFRLDIISPMGSGYLRIPLDV